MIPCFTNPTHEYEQKDSGMRVSPVGMEKYTGLSAKCCKIKKNIGVGKS